MSDNDIMTGEELGEKLLESVRQMKRGEAARVTHVTISAARAARQRMELSQSDFAELMGVSVRTLQEWEQGRRIPHGPAMQLLKVATKHPEVLLDI